MLTIVLAACGGEQDRDATTNADADATGTRSAELLALATVTREAELAKLDATEATVTPTIEPIPTVTTIPTATAIPTATETPTGMTESGYVDWLRDFIARLSVTVSRFNKLMEAPNLDLGAWRSDMLYEMGQWKALYEEARQVDPPLKAKETHHFVVRAQERFAAAAEDVEQGVRLRDRSWFGSASTKMGQAIEYMNEVERLLGRWPD